LTFEVFLAISFPCCAFAIFYTNLIFCSLLFSLFFSSFLFSFRLSPFPLYRTSSSYPYFFFSLSPASTMAIALTPARVVAGARRNPICDRHRREAVARALERKGKIILGALTLLTCLCLAQPDLTAVPQPSQPATDPAVPASGGDPAPQDGPRPAAAPAGAAAPPATDDDAGAAGAAGAPAKRRRGRPPGSGKKRPRYDDDQPGQPAPAPPPPPPEEPAEEAPPREPRYTSTINRGLWDVIRYAAAQPGAPFPLEAQQACYEAMNRMADSLSKAATLASQLICLAVALRDGPDAELYPPPVPTVIRRLVVDQNAYQAAISLCSDTGRSLASKASNQPYVKYVFQHHFAPQFPANFPWPRTTNVGNGVPYLAKEMAVNYQNYVNITVHQHMRKHLHNISGTTWRESAGAWRDAVTDLGNRDYSKILNVNVNQRGEPVVPQVYRMAWQYAVFMELDGAERLNSAILQEIEAHNQQAIGVPGAIDYSGFALAPLRHCQRQFVTIDQRWLTMARVPRTVADFYPGRKGYAAGKTFKTDGVGVALPYERPRVGLELGLPEPIVEDHPLDDGYGHGADHEHVVPFLLLNEHHKGLFALRKIVPGTATDPETGQPREWEAFDPGMRSLLTGSRGTNISSRQWRHWCGIRDAERKLTAIKARADFGWVEGWLQVCHYKTSSAAEFKQSLALNTDDTIWGAQWRLFGTRAHCRRRFRKMMLRTAAWDRMANTVLGPKRDRIAVIGNAVFRSSRKGYPPVPTKSVWYHLAARGLVVLVDEFRTSIICCICHSRNREPGKRPNGKKMFGLLHCTNPACSITWNRDVNAATNIALIWTEYHQHRPRPLALRRPQ
jgi:hypothetical protein